MGIVSPRRLPHLNEVYTIFKCVTFTETLGVILTLMYSDSLCSQQQTETLKCVTAAAVGARFERGKKRKKKNHGNVFVSSMLH